MAASSDFLTRAIARFSRQQLNHMCYGKSKYRTEERAKAYAAKVHERDGVRLTWYLCTHCQWWHLTKVFSQIRNVHTWMKFYPEGFHEGD